MTVFQLDPFGQARSESYAMGRSDERKEWEAPHLAMQAELMECESALLALLDKEPQLAGALCGSTTLGNRLTHLIALRGRINGENADGQR